MNKPDHTERGLNYDSVSNLFECLPIGFLSFNKKGIITNVNSNLFEFGLNEINSGDLIGKNIFESFLYEAYNLSTEFTSIDSFDFFEKEISSLSSLSGNRINIIVKGAPLITNGAVEGGVLIAEDIGVAADQQKASIFSTSYFQKIISSLFSFFILIDNKKQIVLTSSKNHTKNYKFVDLAEKELRSLLKIENIELIEQTLENLQKQTAPQHEIIQITEDNLNKHFKIDYIPFINSGNNIEFILLLFSDITKEIIIKEDRESEVQELRRYYDISNAITDGIININVEGEIIFWNDAASELFGISKSEVFGKFIGKVIPAIDEDYLRILLNELNEQKTWKGEFWSTDTVKESELISARMALVKDEGYIIILCTSITERANIEKQLRKSEERFRNIVTNTREYICTFELDGKINYVNPFFSREFGYTENELISMNLRYLMDSEQIEKFNIDIDKLFEEQRDSVEITLIRKDQAKVHVLANFTAVKDISGRTSYYNAVFTDITEKKNAEKDLLMIRSVFEASQDGIAIQSGRNYILVNDSFVRMFGYNSVEDVLGRDMLHFVADEDMERVAKYMSYFEDGLDAPERYVYKAKKNDNSIFLVEKSTSSYETAEGLSIVSTYRDITKEQKAIGDLEVSEERYRSITENLNDCVWTAERKDGILKAVFYSDVITRITGYSNEAFLQDEKLWYRIIHPNEAANVVAKLRRFYPDNVRDSVELEYRIINNLGNIVWIQNKINVLRNDDGDVEKIFGLVSDITLSKRGEDELKKYADELKVLNETKDRFISIISHDLRTPFSSILGFTDMLLSDRNMTEEKQIQYISFIQESSRNMLSLVNSLLDWTRLQTGRVRFEPQRINSKYVVTKAIQMLSGAALQKNINLVSDLNNDVFVHADESLLLQVFNNLVSNAIKFTEKGGSITISSAPIVRKRQVQFRVKDTGIGIKEEDLPKLFKVDLKYTTKGTSGESGSGLGLSLCYDIVKKHGGEIAVSSEYGEGTEIIFTIPVSSTKILLVDDSRYDRILYSKLIKNFVSNYTVEEVENGKEAFKKILTTYPALVITDHDMPVMSGYSLVQQVNLSDIRYKPPIIVLSSDLTDSIIKEYKELGVEFAFKKPVNLTTLKIAIDKSLKKAIS